MKITQAFLFLFLMFSSRIIFAEEDQLCQFKIALDLCYSSSSSADAGFIAAKSAIETYKNDKELVLLLKEAMCIRLLSKEYHNEIIEIAEDVIKDSSDPLHIGTAWFQKSRMAYFDDELKKSIIYADIALNTLVKGAGSFDPSIYSSR